MSYLSTSGNVGFSGIPQSISDSSCATQYKMGVDNVPGVVTGDVTLYPNDISVDEQTYIPHVNDYYNSKFKIDPDDLYTFNDSDIIANEITVPHTEDNFVYNDTIEYKEDDENQQDYSFIGRLSNGVVKVEVKEDLIPNGHYNSSTKNVTFKNDSNPKVVKAQNHIKKDAVRRNSANEKLKTNGSKGNIGNKNVPTDSSSITSVKLNHVNNVSANKTGSETFLDVFKREQMGLNDALEVTNDKHTTPGATLKSSSTSKKSSKSSKSRRGRGPALHEALQRIHGNKKVIAVQNGPWHAPGDHLYEYGPLMDKRYLPFQINELSKEDSDEEAIRLNFDMWQGNIEEIGVEGRQSRLTMRRAALRRQVALVSATNKLHTSYKSHRSLLAALKKQFNRGGQAHRLSPHIISQLLADRGMRNLLSNNEKKRLRESGWNVGESEIFNNDQTCIEDDCENLIIPCSRFCLHHVTSAHDQQLYASCAAVFAGGTRCQQPLLPLHDQTPLCPEHAWKRDNYDKINREFKQQPKKIVRKRVYATSPRRAKRRRRPPAKLRMPPNVPSNTQTLTELNVCSNSSYDSSEDTGIGGLSDNEYMLSNIPSSMGAPSSTLEVCEVGQVSADDILDPAVLSQIPDEAFTEFFNQCEDAPTFVESEELTRALEAVLDERSLDMADCMFNPPQHTTRNKMSVPTSVTVEVSSVAPS